MGPGLGVMSTKQPLEHKGELGPERVCLAPGTHSDSVVEQRVF